MTAISIIIGIWLVVAPFVFTFSTAALWSNIIAGVLAAGVALYASLGPQRFYAVAVIGLYVAVSSFFFGLGTAPLWLNVVAGIILIGVGYFGARSEEPLSRTTT